MGRMIMTLAAFFLFFAGADAAEHGGEAKTIRHELRVILSPEEGRIDAEDRITLPEGMAGEFDMLLHKGMNPSAVTPGARIRRTGDHGGGPVPIERFRVTLPAGLGSFTLRYAGRISHPLEAVGKEQARGFRKTAGIISGDGVYLDGGSYWYPRIDDGMVTFSLFVDLPSGWDAVSQGERSGHEKGRRTFVQWDSPELQEEIFLVAGKYSEYVKTSGGITAMVFLRRPDEKLAGTYLDATSRYLSMYEDLIGPYPYRKFALVENFWETGFGMPSFALLGPTVIRLPFIVHTSYPHEILHNWWGNGVFPDYEKGNWAEGLTAYLSDHLMKEREGKAPEYRVETLQKYADYVLEGKDFSLAEFRSRHSPSSEAIGYGKSLMLFHMLRQEVGDRAFVEGLRLFYRTHRFRPAGFEDLRQSFEKESGKDLRPFFGQWVMKAGGPEIRLWDWDTAKSEKGYRLSFVLEQVQPGTPYDLRVPVVITAEGREEAVLATLRTDAKRLRFSLDLIDLPSRPLRLDVDPEFDLFRRLHREELPPALSSSLGAKKMLILLPSGANDEILAAYQEFARTIALSGPDEVQIRTDESIPSLPVDRTVTILGWENRFFSEAIASLSKAGFDVLDGRESISINGTAFLREDHAVAFAGRNPGNPGESLMVIATGRMGNLRGLGRKLPHYHKYSFLAFRGDEPENVLKGRWPVTDSPMTAFLPAEDGSLRRIPMGRLPSRQSLASPPPVFSRERMMDMVSALSGEEMEGRGFGTEGLDKAADLIARGFREAGLVPGGDEEGSFFQTWKDRGADPEKEVLLRNVIGILPGSNPDFRGQSIVIGAHYDHLGHGWPDVREGSRGKIHPGADDNASGVAVLLELARVLGAILKPERSAVFAAFSGEEAGRRGSRRFLKVRKGATQGEIIGMLNLDTVGRLGSRKLLALGAGSAAEWPHILRGAGFVTGVEIDLAKERLDASDNVSFEEAGIPAVQLFTGPHLDYHRPTDRPERIDAEGLVKVAAVSKEIIEYLGGRKERLTASANHGSAEEGEKRGRKVSLGTIPDFAFGGSGCRLSGVVPGSPAEACGLAAGDIIVRIGDRPVKGLRDLSEILKSLSAGDKVTVFFVRDGDEMTAEAEVVER